MARETFVKKASEDTCTKVMQAFDYAIEDGSISHKPLWLWLSEQVNSIEKMTKRVYKKASLYADDTDYSDFHVIWDMWPKNAKWPEKQESAMASWVSATKKYGLDTVKAVCTHYVTAFSDPSYGMVHPYHLGNFIADDVKFAEWRARYVIAPSPEDASEFSAVWGWFPDFVGSSAESKGDSLTFWARHIAKGERWAFLSAVKQYRDERNADTSINAKKFNRSLISFIGSAWQEMPTASVMGADISVTIVTWAREQKLAHGQAALKALANMHALITSHLASGEDVRTAIKFAVDYLAAKNSRTLDVEASVTEIYDKAWALACRPPIVKQR